jgi:hypothetical protein
MVQSAALMVLLELFVVAVLLFRQWFLLLLSHRFQK